AALVARVNGTLQDLDQPLERDANLELLDFSTPEGRAAFWRSSACVLGAVAEQFYGATLCSSQATEDGFFCDVHMGERTVQRGELPALEEACAAFARAGHRFERLEATRQQLSELFKHNSFQLQRIEEEVTSPTATVYRCGPLLQLCHGPFLQHTGLIEALRVLTSSAAFWQGAGGRQSLQRVTAVAFPSAQDLADWQQAQDEAALRDHRRIGREQELFFFHKLSPGSCFFLPCGAHIYNTLIDFIRSEYQARGFHEVVTPNVFSPQLWELSGYWQHYSTHMFSFTAGTETLSLKPMNCPAHCLMFAHRPRSWRELPLRLADFGVLHRNEPPGTLTGLTRVRRFQQDDAHIFCTLEQASVPSCSLLLPFRVPPRRVTPLLTPCPQLESEIDACLDFVRTVYAVLGFSFRLALATRPPGFLGDPETWDRAEEQLERSLRTFGQPWELSAGDGAFYGPKIDIRIRDALGRQHQCGTIQLDFQMPERFELEYARFPETPAGSPGTPWVMGVGDGCGTGGQWVPTWVWAHPWVDARVGGCTRHRAGVTGWVAGACAGEGGHGPTHSPTRDPPPGTVVGRRERERGTVSVRTRDNRQLGERDLRWVLQRLQELRDARV
ncbi:SYTM protein, partial [Sula dactylatra]|nr:SYTM protein [Sula dactylatra]